MLGICVLFKRSLFLSFFLTTQTLFPLQYNQPWPHTSVQGASVWVEKKTKQKIQTKNTTVLRQNITDNIHSTNCSVKTREGEKWVSKIIYYHCHRQSVSQRKEEREREKGENVKNNKKKAKHVRMKLQQQQQLQCSSIAIYPNTSRAVWSALESSTLLFYLAQT